MTALACALYLLGALGAYCAISRDAPLGPREFFCCLTWPAVVIAAVAWGLLSYAVRGRP